MLSRCLRHRAPVLWILLPFIGGLIGARIEIISWPVLPLLSLAAGSLIAAFVVRRKGWLWGLLFVASGVMSGATLYQMTTQRLALWDTLPPRETQLTIQVRRNFGLHSGSKNTSGIGTITATGKTQPELRGQQVYFSVAHRTADPMPVRSEVLLISGVLAVIPRHADVTTFDGFLINSGVNFRLSRGRVLHQVQPPTAYNRFCQRALQRLSRILNRGLESRASLSVIYRGMVLGEVTDLAPEQNLMFRESGTMHLFSISGLHIAAIAIALHMLLGLFRLPRWASVTASVMMLWLYVDITGESPSAVRALVMVALLEIAFVLRRAVNPVATLAFAALVSLLANPMQLFGASFQMSYGIVAALLLLGLPLADYGQEKWVLFRHTPKVTWHRWQHALSWVHRGLTSALGIGFSTSLVSAIAGVLYFQLLTPGALIANLVLIPVSSLALWSGFLSLLFGLIGLGWLSNVFNHAAALTLFAMEKGIQIFLKIPGVFAAAHFTSPPIGYVAFAGLLVTLFFGYAVAWRPRYGHWWPPFAWVILALGIGAHFG